MKYLVLLCDGMADRPNKNLGGHTPMELANKPNTDALCKTAEIGMCKTVPNGFKPGSDVANLSVMGYNPAECYTGRSPLEAASIGVKLADTDVSLRCNLVTLSDEPDYCKKTMLDYSGGDISTEEAAELIKSVQAAFGNETYAYYSGVAYRHCLVVKNGTTELGNMTPPHDISGRVIGEYLSKSENAAGLINMMKKSYELLKDHPVNKARISKGLRPANSIWLWGEGRRPSLEDFKSKWGVSACVVSAVDLLKGIAVCGNMKAPDVADATGYIDTNFEGKAAAGINLWKEGCNLLYMHLEAPDECGHRGQPEKKVKAIELIDEKVLSPLLDYLKSIREDYHILIMPDHPTPLEIMTHCADPVPYLLYKSESPEKGADTFSESTAKATGIFVSEGHRMMGKLLDK